MDIRKLQKTGGSTFVVSLPKKWVVSKGLKKSDSLMIQVQPDSSLTIVPHSEKGRHREKLKKSLFVSEEGLAYLQRELVGCYVMGYELIEVKAQEFIGKETRAIVRDFTTKVMGIEIVDESVNKIILKDIMNPNELPFDTTLKRMFNIVKSMHNNTIFALENLSREMAQNVISMDFEVNKLYWFVFRHLNILLKNPGSMQVDRGGPISYKNALSYFLISRNLERIGDHLHNICRAIVDLPEVEIPPTIIAELVRLSGENFATLQRSMGTLFTKDIACLNTVFESVENLKPDIKRLRDDIQNRASPCALQLGQMLDSVKRIGDYAKDIAEYMINHIVDLESYSSSGKRKVASRD